MYIVSMSNFYAKAIVIIVNVAMIHSFKRLYKQNYNFYVLFMYRFVLTANDEYLA